MDTRYVIIVVYVPKSFLTTNTDDSEELIPFYLVLDKSRNVISFSAWNKEKAENKAILLNESTGNVYIKDTLSEYNCVLTDDDIITGISKIPENLEEKKPALSDKAHSEITNIIKENIALKNTLENINTVQHAKKHE
ncbi:hypothetical protein ACWXWE_22290 [Pantoea ananatis]